MLKAGMSLANQAGWVLSFFFLATLNSQEVHPLINHAEKLFQEGLYGDALPLYQEVYQTHMATRPEHTSFLSIRQAECLLELKEDQQAILLLSALTSALSPQQETQKNYLSALAYRRLKCYQEALLALEPISKEPFLNQEIQLERGLNFFHLDQLSQAKEAFEAISQDESKIQLYAMAQIYLARIALKNQQTQRALTYLSQSEKVLTPNDPIRFELTYLQGLAHFLEENYPQAITHFSTAFPKQAANACEWYLNTIYYLAQSYIKWTEDSILKKEHLADLFNKAEDLLQKALTISQEEKFSLVLAELYLTKARRLQDEEAYQKGHNLLMKQIQFASKEEAYQTLLLEAATAPNYVDRQRLYHQLTAEEYQLNVLFPEAWYNKGINDYEEGMHSKENALTKAQANEMFSQATLSFDKAFTLFEPIDPKKAALALKYQALCYLYQETQATDQQAWSLLNQLVEDKATLLNSLAEPEEIDYLASLIGLSLLAKGSSIPFLEKKIEDRIQEGLKRASSQSRWIELLLKAWGTLLFRKGHYEEADLIFSRWANQYPQSTHMAEILFWRAKCAEEQKDLNRMRQYLQQIFTQKSESPYAAQAYFSYYSYREYLRGSRKAIKHLEAMEDHFPDHPLLITAYYLIGLDHKKDHLSEEGKVQKRKDFTAAIEAFQQAESTFTLLSQNQQIPDVDLSYFTHVRYRSTLERALANLAIAEESQGAKQHIYLSYAEEVFAQIMDDFHHAISPLKEALYKNEVYPKLLEEAEFWLAQTRLKNGEIAKAEECLNHMLEHVEAAEQTKGYFLSRLWYEKGKLAQMHQDHSTALHHFHQAEKASMGLSPDQKLDLWIQQSLCYQKLGQFEEAMRILSKVINDEAISGLRIKAMVLRAEIYELQGRPELALKQLEAAAKKGGEWGKKAKDKLEKNYGY